MSILSCGPGRVALVAVLTCGVASACAARHPFDHYLAEQRWSEAARAFAADSALMNDEHALWQAGMLYSSPTRPTYDPDRARALLERLLSRFPETRHQTDARDRLALVDEVLSARDSAVARQRAIESRIAELTAEVQRLHAGLDSAESQRDMLRRNAARLESDLRDRDEQLRALRLELKQLKEIDLKPRVPRKPPS
jgi:hypothetical protein